tara:strand:- start:324 stop:587 length:264 start_codon:yes stop_codon:yes gene_type:complete
MDKKSKEYFDFLITEYNKGNKKIQGNHPKEVKEAIDSFFAAGQILVEHPEADHIPTEYVTNLLKALGKYPQYTALVLDLVSLLNHEK